MKPGIAYILTGLDTANGTVSMALDIAEGIAPFFRPFMLLTDPYSPSRLPKLNGVEVLPARRANENVPWYRDVRFILAALRASRRRNIRIFHSFFTFGQIYGCMLAALSRARSVRTVGGWETNDFSPVESSCRRFGLRRLWARLTDRYVVVNPELIDHAIRRLGATPDQVETIPNGLSIGRFNVAPEVRLRVSRELGLRPQNRVIGSAGRLVPIKDIPTLLRAVAIVRDSIPEVVLLVAGDGPEMQSLRRLAAELTLEKHVRFLGVHRDMPGLVSVWDVLAMPSLHEGMSRTVLEALAAGKPVVGSAVPGIRELVADGVTGLLCPPSNPAALAQNLVRILQDDAMRSDMGRRARAAAQAYTMESCIEKHVSLYGDLLNRRSGKEDPVAGTKGTAT